MVKKWGHFSKGRKMLDKREQRLYFKNLRNSISCQDKAEWERKISENIISSDEYKKAEDIFTYVGVNGETDTFSLIRKAFEDDKKVFVPVMTDKKHIMVFTPLKDISNLRERKYGILEPDLGEIIFPEENSLIITPALAFDRDFYRLGYGGGYYDTFFSNNKGIKMGICFDVQLTDFVQRGEYDKPVDIIITDKVVRRRI